MKEESNAGKQQPEEQNKVIVENAALCSVCGRYINEANDSCPYRGCGYAYNQQCYCQTPDGNPNSILSVLACVLALFTILSPVAFVLALVDLGINDKSKKHTGSWFAIVYPLILMGIVIVVFLCLTLTVIKELSLYA
ncbi:MAG: hypothetical protein K2G45_05025 [Lachnospiraceae bacterium]|nr:hypothetical protein [Lachnospiraceae bacterium]